MIVIPTEGHLAHIQRILTPNLRLKLFKTDVISGLTGAQIRALTESDFVEATFAGYSFMPITAGAWSFVGQPSPGAPAQAQYAQQTFAASADGAQTIYGYYVTTVAGALEWYEYFTSPQSIAHAGDTIKVTPVFTYTHQT